MNREQHDKRKQTLMQLTIDELIERKIKDEQRIREADAIIIELTKVPQKISTQDESSAWSKVETYMRTYGLHDKVRHVQLNEGGKP